MRGGLLSCALFLITGAELGAQDAPTAGPGDRVRVLAAGAGVQGWLSGTVLSRGTDTLLLQVGDTEAQVAMPLAAIQRLQVSLGRHGHALTGFEVGFLVGAVTAGVAYTACQGFLCPENKNVAAGAAVAAFAGLLCGVPGAAIGALIRGEEWENVPLSRVRVSATPGRRGLTVGLAVRF